MTEQELLDHDDARIHKRIIPQKPPVGKQFEEWVTIDSPEWQRLPIVQFRRYLGIECDYGMSFDASDECWEKLEVHTITDRYYDEDECAMKSWLVGAICMVREESQSRLGWAWIHPFWRNKGKLEKAYQNIKNRFNEGFYIERPVSPSMIGALRKLNHVDTITNPKLVGAHFDPKKQPFEVIIVK